MVVPSVDQCHPNWNVSQGTGRAEPAKPSTDDYDMLTRVAPYRGMRPRRLRSKGQVTSRLRGAMLPTAALQGRDMGLGHLTSPHQVTAMTSRIISDGATNDPIRIFCLFQQEYRVWHQLG
jgi:hypothetical protein